MTWNPAELRSVELRCAIGITYFCMGQFDEAFTAFMAAVKTDQEHAETWFNFGVLYNTQSNLDEEA